MNLDEQIIPELPFTWRMALTQGSTGVVAQPTQEQIDNVKQLAIYLVPVIELIGGASINSWLRTPEHNKAVFGARNSQHLYGRAVDLHIKDKTVVQAKELLKQMTNRKLYFEINTTNWLHLDYGHDHDFIA